MIGADEINAAIEENRQALLRKAAKDATRTNGIKMFVGHDAEFDLVGGIPGGVMLLRLRDPHAGIMQVPDGEYGS